MKTLLVTACLFLSSTTCSTLTNAKDFLPPNLAFKPILKGNTITINIAEGYYLYKEKINVLSNNRDVEFSFVDKPISKNFQNYGSHAVYLDKTQLKIPQSATPPLTIRFQGCSSQGLCYPPQQVTLTAN